MKNTIKISEIFTSIQGEGPNTGKPTTFIRTQGCPYRCVWCDSEYTWDFKTGAPMTIDQIFDQVPVWINHVCITGGEPFAQDIQPLINVLGYADRHSVSIETSGLHKIPSFDYVRPQIIMDWKCPDSGEGNSIGQKLKMENNLKMLIRGDVIKFVVMTENDLKHMAAMYSLYYKNTMASMYVSPVVGDKAEITPKQVAEFIIDNKMDITIQYQLHKILEMR